MNDDSAVEYPMKETTLEKAERDLNMAFNILDTVNRGEDQWTHRNPWYRRLFGLKTEPNYDSIHLRKARKQAEQYIDACAIHLSRELYDAVENPDAPPMQPPFRPEGIAEAQGGGGGGPSSPLVQALDEVDASRAQGRGPTAAEASAMDASNCEHDWAATGHDDIHRCTKCKMHIGYDPASFGECRPHDWHTRIAGGLECSRCGAILEGAIAGEVDRE